MLHRRASLPDPDRRASTVLTVTVLATTAIALIWMGASLALAWPLNGPSALVLATVALLVMLRLATSMAPSQRADGIAAGDSQVESLAAAQPPAAQPPATQPGSRPAPLEPLLRRICQGLPGPAVLVQRSSPESPWRIVAMNDAAAATATRLGLAGTCKLNLWLDQASDWPGEAIRQALAHPVAAQADQPPRRFDVLAADELTAVVWLVSQGGRPAGSTEPRAEARSEPRDSFAYTISHDLRAPIRVIEGFTRIVREDYGANLDRVGNDHLDRILGAATRMNNMIDSILALSRLSSQALAQQPVDLSEMAQQVFDELRRQAPERDVETCVTAGLTTLADPTLLRMVFDNLLGNAWKYSARNPGARIEFGCQPDADGNKPVYYVRDNGAGFDMRFANRLFGPFQRLHSASEFAGTGVGLASVKRIVERHGGRIWAEAEVDKGATFYFTLG